MNWIPVDYARPPIADTPRASSEVVWVSDGENIAKSQYFRCGLNKVGFWTQPRTPITDEVTYKIKKITHWRFFNK